MCYVLSHMQSYTEAITLDQTLDWMRLKGDNLADSLLRDNFSRENGKKELMLWLGTLQTNKDLEAPHSFLQGKNKEAIQEMLQVPAWLNDQKILLAREFFTRHSPWVMNLLGLLSLPFCYAAADGARVLCFTERLTKKPEDRLRETAEFIWEIMNPKAFEPGSKALCSILKVRLIHATIRYYILQDPTWNSDWGLPINQEDMAGTNLAFSLVILRGLRKVGIQASELEKEAFLHLWNGVGHMMGLENSMIPDKVADTILLEKTIRKRQFKSSLHGRELTQILTEYFNTIPSDPKKPKVVLQNWMVELISEPIASMIGLYPLPEKGIPLKWIQYLNQLGVLDPGKNKATYESRYKTYLHQNTQSRSAPGINRDYSAFPLPTGLNISH